MCKFKELSFLPEVVGVLGCLGRCRGTDPSLCCLVTGKGCWGMVGDMYLQLCSDLTWASSMKSGGGEEQAVRLFAWRDTARFARNMFAGAWATDS